MDAVLLLRAHTDGQEVLGAGLSDYLYQVAVGAS